MARGRVDSMSTSSAGLARHYLRYSTANVLVLMAGLVSFPLLTRLLDNTQYGILGYYETWVLMAVAVAKLGAQHSIQRFYPHGGDEERLRSFGTNLFYLPLLGSLVLWAFVGAVAIVHGQVTGEGHSPVFWMALVMTPMLVYSSLVETVLRVTEQSRTVMVTRVATRWLQLALMLGAVLALQHTAAAAYGGKLVAVVFGMAFYVWWARRNLRFARKAVDAGEIRQSFTYGMPLVATEILAVALVSIDRIMLKSLSGDFAVVGIYSVGAALAMQVHMFMNLTVFESFTPAANRVYVTEGNAAVRALKRTMLMPMTYAAVGVALLLWCLGTDLIIALSGVGQGGVGAGVRTDGRDERDTSRAAGLRVRPGAGTPNEDRDGVDVRRGGDQRAAQLVVDSHARRDGRGLRDAGELGGVEHGGVPAGRPGAATVPGPAYVADGRSWRGCSR